MIKAGGKWKIDDDTYTTVDELRKFTALPDIWRDMIEAALKENS